MKTKKLPQAIAELKDYRERNGLTYQELADRMNQDPSYNMDPQRLRYWIVGKVNPLDTSLKQVELFLRREYTNDITNHFSKDVKYIDSRLVAQWAGKTHRHLMRDIRKHVDDLKKAQEQLKDRGAQTWTDPQSAGKYGILDPDLYFIESSFIDPQNKTKYPSFLVSRLGCEMIAHKMTGVKGTQFTALYINEFHRMKDNEQAKHIDHDQKATKPIEQEDLFKATSELQEAPQWSDEFLSFDYQESLTDEEKRDLEFLRHKLDRLKDCNSLDTLKGGLLQVVNLIKLLDK